MNCQSAAGFESRGRTLGANELALGPAGLGVCRALAVIGFFGGAVWLGHDEIPAGEEWIR